MVLARCEFSESLVEGYRCEVVSQVLSENLIFVGRHAAGKSNDDVVALDFRACEFLDFPTNIHQSFAHLQSLQLVDCDVTALRREHLAKLTELTSFCAVNCGLKSLPGDLFRDLKHLEEINLSRNKIEEVDAKAFDNLEQLVLVDLRGNPTVDLCFDTKYYPETSCGSLDVLRHVVQLNCQPNYPKKPQEPADKAEKVSWNALLHDLMRVFHDDAFRDFTINVGDASFRVHKSLFAARIATLADTVRNNPRVDSMTLCDVPAPVFRVIHDFVYSNRLPEQLPDRVSKLELLEAAARLKVPALERAVTARLVADVDAENGLKLLELSDKLGNEELRERAFEVIRDEIFGEHKLDEELARQPHKLRQLVEAKRKYETLLRDVEVGGANVDEVDS